MLLLCLALFACGPAEESKPKADTAGQGSDAAATVTSAAGTVQVCGCKADGDCASFDDGDVCNGSYVCVEKGCAFTGKALLCDDGNPCTLDSCDKAKGCQYSFTPDGTSCTEAYQGTCVQGVCIEATCGLGYDPVEVDDNGKKVTQCAAWGPVWGTTKPSFLETEPVTGEKVVTDQVSKLMFNGNSSAIAVTDAAAVTGCESMVYGIVDLHTAKPANDPQAFLNAEFHAYTATSTIKQSDTGRFYGVRLSCGTTADRKKVEEPALVRCVRDLP